jgi:hypothetical protein
MSLEICFYKDIEEFFHFLLLSRLLGMLSQTLNDRDGRIAREDSGSLPSTCPTSLRTDHCWVYLQFLKVFHSSWLVLLILSCIRIFTTNGCRSSIRVLLSDLPNAERHKRPVCTLMDCIESPLTTIQRYIATPILDNLQSIPPNIRNPHTKTSFPMRGPDSGASCRRLTLIPSRIEKTSESVLREIDTTSPRKRGSETETGGKWVRNWDVAVLKRELENPSNQNQTKKSAPTL